MLRQLTDENLCAEPLVKAWEESRRKHMHGIFDTPYKWSGSRRFLGYSKAKIKANNYERTDNMTDTRDEFLCVHEDVVEKVTAKMPPDEILYDLAELYKVFGDTTRIRILYALLESELCVNDLAQLLGLSQTAASHQLRVLKNNKLVKFRKEGKIVFYSLSDDHVRSIIETGMEHVEE